MSVVESDRLDVRISLRLGQGTLGLLQKLSKSTGLPVSTMIRKAINHWLTTLPPDEDIHITTPATRLAVKEVKDTIRDLRYIYHQWTEALQMMVTIRKGILDAKFPPHALQALTQLEKELEAKITQFDNWLRKQYPPTQEDP